MEHYRDMGIDVVNSTGDQFSLLRESLPGDRVRLSSYVQRQPLYTIAGGVPTATVDLGDRIAQDGQGWVGPYIGETLGRARSVVHFDPLLAAALNRPDRDRHHRRAGRRQDHPGAAADPATARCAA